MNKLAQLPTLARGVYTPSKPYGWVLESINGDMKCSLRKSKPAHYNQELFKLVEVFTVQAD